MGQDSKDFDTLIAKISNGEGDNDEIIQRLKAMKHDLDRYETMLYYVPCTISHIGKDFKYIGVNKELADMCNMDEAEFIGNEVGFNSEHQYFTNFSRDLFASRKSTLTRELESDVNDEKKFFYTQGLKIKNDEEAVIIGVDVTELNNLKDTVVFLDRLSSVGEMMAGILHEISNPLTLIKNHGAILERSVEKELSKEKVLKSAQIISKTSNKIEKIVAGIKAFVRKTEDKAPEETDFEKILDDSILICERALDDAGVELKRCKDNWPKIKVNETQIFQVFVNLIINAIHAIEELETKWIEIDWSETKDHFIFTLTDSGSGIDLAVQEKIFSSFFTTKGVGKGTGLGLSLCLKILEGHGGRIYIDNDHPHTRFVIEVPKI